MTSICVIIISSLVSLYFLNQNARHAELYSVLLASPLVVLFGELIPKTVYQRHATRVAPWVARPVSIDFLGVFPDHPFSRALYEPDLESDRADRGTAHRKEAHHAR